MDILRIVVKKRSEDKVNMKQDTDSLNSFATRVAKLRGEGPMATSEEPEVALEVVSINIKDIEVPSSFPRKNIGDLQPLIASIRVFGIQQPLKVVKVKGTKKYRLVFGKRRLEAAEIAGLDAVPCIVELVTREDRLQMLSLVENLHRFCLHPMEEAATLQNLLAQTSNEEICKNLGIAEESMHNVLKLLDLPAPVKAEVLEHSSKFTYEVLQVLWSTYAQSKSNGKKLLGAIIAGEISNAAEAKAYSAKS